jgi:hypothetical protein
MTRQRLALSFVIATLATRCLAADPEGDNAPQLPVSPPPQFAMVSEILKDESRVAIQYSTTVPVTEMVTVERVVSGQTVTEQLPRMVYRVEVRTNEADLSDLVFFGVDGKEVPTKEALSRLRVGLMLLRMAEAGPPVPEFRKVLAKDALIVTPRE